MKNKNGFTLIELLTTVALLGILAIVIYPNVTEQIEKKKNEVEQAKLELIYSGAKDYILENQDKEAYYLNVGDKYCISLDKLALDIDRNEKYVEVKIGENNNYIYNIVASCTESK